MSMDRIIYTLGALGAVLLSVDFVYHRHAYIPIEGTPGFYAIAGLLLPAGLLLGGLALKFLFGRAEDYYGFRDVAAEAFPKDQVDPDSNLKKQVKKGEKK